MDSMSWTIIVVSTLFFGTEVFLTYFLRKRSFETRFAFQFVLWFSLMLGSVVFLGEFGIAIGALVGSVTILVCALIRTLLISHPSHGQGMDEGL